MSPDFEPPHEARITSNDRSPGQIVGQRVHSIRRDAGLPAASVSSSAGISEDLLAHVERGDDDVDLGVLFQIADALQVCPSELVRNIAPSVRDSELVADTVASGMLMGRRDR